MKKIFILIILLVLTSCGEKTYVGNFEFEKGTFDPLLNIETDCPILYREVEMVQYYKDGEDVKQVFANYHIDSFDEYINPDFPNDISNEIFHSDISINGIPLSDDIIKAIVYSDIEKNKLVDLPKENGNKYNLVELNGTYVTASDEWNVGEIRITYYTIDCSKKYSIKAKVLDDELVYVDSFEIKEVD